MHEVHIAKICYFPRIIAGRVLIFGWMDARQARVRNDEFMGQAEARILPGRSNVPRDRAAAMG